MIPVRHIGELGCGEIAFYFKKRLDIGDEVSSSNVVLLNGELPEEGSVMVCGHCGDYVFPNKLSLSQEEDTDTGAKL